MNAPLVIGPLHLSIVFPKTLAGFLAPYRPWASPRARALPLTLTLSAQSVRMCRSITVQMRRVRGCVSVAREDFEGLIDTHTRTARFSVQPNYYSVNSLLRVITSLIGARLRLLVLHASGLVIEKSAHLFVGTSGSGKSTVIKNAPRCESLGDELVGVWLAPGGPRAVSTPFGGELPQARTPVTVPLAALYLLAQRTRVELSKARPRESIARLLRCVLNFSRDTEETRMISRLIKTLTDRVPVYDFGATIDSSFPTIYNTYREDIDAHLC